jgi:hypothetical protein
MRGILSFCAMAILALAAFGVASAEAKEAIQFGSGTQTAITVALPQTGPTQLVETGQAVAVLPSTSTDGGAFASMALGSIALAALAGGAIAFGVRRGR